MHTVFNAPVPVCANTPANMKHNMAPADSPVAASAHGAGCAASNDADKARATAITHWGTLCTVHAQTGYPSEDLHQGSLSESRRPPFLS
ncbi:hypothetical protein SKAU_G00030790 [Synaphobranchus kaupii]|uniref:Uncharacterized protein n=1 Tax=Synaphobranchus kaupii TaxID=118154 RepID=A0A9Q1JD51_SYNKA|nr:hypothetical protein SKAU_G00030790 [Synaphobranchus kaupii]